MNHKAQIIECLKTGPASAADIADFISVGNLPRSFGGTISGLVRSGVILKNAEGLYYLNAYKNNSDLILKQMSKLKEGIGLEEFTAEELAQLMRDMLDEIYSLRSQITDYKNHIERLFAPAREARIYFERKTDNGNG